MRSILYRVYLYLCINLYVSKLLFIYSSSIHILFRRSFIYYDYYYYCFSTANVSFQTSLQQKNQKERTKNKANAYIFHILKNNPNLNLFLKRLHFRINSTQFHCCFSFFKCSYYYFIFLHFFMNKMKKVMLTEILRKKKNEII